LVTAANWFLVAFWELFSGMWEVTFCSHFLLSQIQKRSLQIVHLHMFFGLETWQKSPYALMETISCNLLTGHSNWPLPKKTTWLCRQKKRMWCYTHGHLHFKLQRYIIIILQYNFFRYFKSFLLIVEIWK